MTVAVGFSPRSSTSPGVRRGATLEGCKTSRLSFNRRSATTLLGVSDRGLKPAEAHGYLHRLAPREPSYPGYIPPAVAPAKRILGS